jgi:hypothetical protein
MLSNLRVLWYQVGLYVRVYYFIINDPKAGLSVAAASLRKNFRRNSTDYIHKVTEEQVAKTILSGVAVLAGIISASIIAMLYLKY